jgi:hypothetical protein
MTRYAAAAVRRCIPSSTRTRRFDIFADVIPKAKARGIQTYALFAEDYNGAYIPNFEKIAEVDVYGRIGRNSCHNNPGLRAFLVSLMKDWFSTNDLDGSM